MIELVGLLAMVAGAVVFGDGPVVLIVLVFAIVAVLAGGDK